MSAPSSGTRNFYMIEAIAEWLEGVLGQFWQCWSDEFRERVVAEVMEPGASVLVIVHRIGIHPSQLFGWRCDAHVGQGSSLVPPTIKMATELVCAKAVIEVVIGDVAIQTGADIDEAHLWHIIQAVGSAGSRRT